MTFSSNLLLWYKSHKRELPWRDSKNPYHIWLSEIILQQTRISQGLSYYCKFIHFFPDIYSLAKASEDQVLSLWQGLGYYSRARNMHHTARIIVEKYEGVFPSSPEQLLKLKGVGKYTAAAIASMAFNVPEAAVDGNVIRVISRYFGIDEPVDEPSVKKKIEVLATELLDTTNPGNFNQAMMDFGAMVCKPSSPNCLSCPFNRECFALAQNKIKDIPFKRKKIARSKRFFHFFLVYNPADQMFYIEKRTGNDIWKNLYQLPMVETAAIDFEPGVLQQHTLLKTLADNENTFVVNGSALVMTHELTHQTIHAAFYKVEVRPDFSFIFADRFLKVSLEDFDILAKPVLIKRFIDSNRNLLSA